MKPSWRGSASRSTGGRRRRRCRARIGGRASSTLPRSLDLFVERVRDYRATVVVTDDPRARCGRRARRCRSAAGRHRARPRSRRCVRPGSSSSRTTASAPRELDALDGALTTCAAGCAVTGTIALDGGPGQGRRALSLVPDLHVCVIRAEAIVESVPELIAALEPSAREGRPIVLVSGPSATSDIELNRVEGVHGPRQLVVIVAT